MSLLRIAVAAASLVATALPGVAIAAPSSDAAVTGPPFATPPVVTPPPGPAERSGTLVLHCNALGGAGVVVINRNHADGVGGCRFP